MALVAASQREAYEAAAMGPRGVCLKEQGGAAQGTGTKDGEGVPKELCKGLEWLGGNGM